MRSQSRPSQVFPKLLMRESTMERHATLGYPLPTAPGLGLEISEEALKVLRAPGTVSPQIYLFLAGTF